MSLMLRPPLQARANSGLTFRPDANTVLWLPGQDDAYSATIRDRSGKGNNGSITGATWKRNSQGLWYLHFDGTDDDVDIPIAAALTAGTFVAWFRSSTSGARNALLGSGELDSNQNYVTVEIGGSPSGAYADESFAYSVVDAGVSKLEMYVRNGTDFYNDGACHLAVVRVDGVANGINIDGKAQ